MVMLEKEQTPSFLFSINICFREVLSATWSELCCHGYFPIPASSTSFSASSHQSTVSSSNRPLRTQNYTLQFLVMRRHFLPKMALSYWSLRFLVLGGKKSQSWEWWLMLYIVNSRGNTGTILGYWYSRSLTWCWWAWYWQDFWWV